MATCSSSDGASTSHQRPPSTCLYKLLLIGDSGVGKTELLHRFTDDQAKSRAIGVDFVTRKIELDGKSIKLQIWDTAGQERFHTITSSYYRGTRGIMLVYDVTNQTSFESIDHWLLNINEHMGVGVAKVLVGNLCDETAKKQVGYAIAKEYADKLNIPLLEVNSKSKADVERAFMSLVAEIHTRMK